MRFFSNFEPTYPFSKLCFRGEGNYEDDAIKPRDKMRPRGENITIHHVTQRCVIFTRRFLQKSKITIFTNFKRPYPFSKL